jgi:hypothetical protein
MDSIYKTIIENTAAFNKQNFKAISGKVRLKATGEFTLLNDATPLALFGEFQVQLMIPASASLVGTVTFTQVGGFDANDTYVVSAENNDAVNAARFMMDIKGCYTKAVVAGAGVTAVIKFTGYYVAV